MHRSGHTCAHIQGSTLLKIHSRAHDNTDAGQEHTGTLHAHTYTHTQESQRPAHAKNMKLVLKFALTPAAHIWRFAHTVSMQ